MWTISRALSPAISIDQKTTSKNPRSTVGTVTEIYDYLRLLWARVGTPHCPKCGKEIRQQTIDQIIDQVLALPEGTRIQVMAPVIRGKKGEHAKIFEDARRSGYVRVRVDGNLYELTEEIKLEKNKKHNIEIVVDRLIIRPDIHAAADRQRGDRLRPLRRAGGRQPRAGGAGHPVLPELRLRGLRHLHRGADAPDVLLQQPLRCLSHLYGPGQPAEGGPGPDHAQQVSLHPGGGHQASGWNNIQGDGISRMYFDALAKKYHFSLTTPVKDLPEEVLDVILYGTNGEKLELHYDQPRGKGTLYQPFEGIVQQPGAPLPGDPVRRHAAGAGGVHGRVPLPHLRGQAAAEGVPGGDRGGHRHRRLLTQMSVVNEALDLVDRLELTHQQHAASPTGS